MLIDMVGIRGNLGKSLINSLEGAALLELDNVLISNKAVLGSGNQERSRLGSLFGSWGSQHHGKERKKDGQPHFEGWGLSSFLRGLVRMYLETRSDVLEACADDPRMKRRDNHQDSHLYLCVFHELDIMMIVIILLPTFPIIQMLSLSLIFITFLVWKLCTSSTHIVTLNTSPRDTNSQ